METVTINWIKYDNFFQLWDKHKDDPKLIYVIGDAHHCYVGSIGGSRGKKGLRNRYQRQYLERAKSIFGKDESEGQVAYAGLFANDAAIESPLIRAAEAKIQKCCIDKLGSGYCMFKYKNSVKDVEVTNSGSLPLFL
jgi:hypothetical protein